MKRTGTQVLLVPRFRISYPTIWYWDPADKPEQEGPAPCPYGFNLARWLDLMRSAGMVRNWIDRLGHAEQ